MFNEGFSYNESSITKNNLKAYNQNVFTAVPKICWKFAKNVKLQFEVW